MPATRRNTWQREAVRQTLSDQSRFLSAQQLHEMLSAEGQRMGLATVYRQLGVLVDEGEADVLLSPEGESLYRFCVIDGHHHHLICNTCGRVEEVDAPEVEAWVARVAVEHGFTVSSHIANVFGTCAECHRAE